MVMATMTERNLNLVVPLAHKATARRRTLKTAIERVRHIESAQLFETANSYFGLLRQASHSHQDRARLANALRERGHSIKSDLTKTYRKAAA